MLPQPIFFIHFNGWERGALFQGRRQQHNIEKKRVNSDKPVKYGKMEMVNFIFIKKGTQIVLLFSSQS